MSEVYTLTIDGKDVAGNEGQTVMEVAEENGIDSGNVDQMKSNPPTPEVARMLGVEGDLHKGLGLEPDWAYNIIKLVGNYGEVYEAYMGSGPEGIKIPREGSQNALWTEGGLMYPPPFR